MRFLLMLAVFTWSLGSEWGTLPCDAAEESRWEKDIQRFERLDADKMPPKNAILFVGSSSIRLWDLSRSFPDRVVINRGFGGSEVADSLQFADRIIVRYEPRVVVLYAGDNDIANGKSPEQVVDDFRQLTTLIHDKLPKTKVVFIAVKPSLKRWSLIDRVREVNRRVAELAERDEHLEFVDIDRPMIGADGMPRKELFVADGLHLSEEGYALWTSLVGPHLK